MAKGIIFNMTDYSNMNGIGNNEWTFLLFMLFIEDARQKNEEWLQFEQGLIYKNRFSSNSPIVDELHKREKQATMILPRSKELYRARSFKRSSFDKLVEYYMKEHGCSKEEIDTVLKEWTNEQKLMTLLPQLYSDIGPDYLNNNKETSALVNAQKKWKTRIRFKGYNAKDSTAPVPELIGNGRANPDHIRYLYLCEDNVTPIYEIRPIIGEQVSIAKFQLQRDVKLFDLTLNIQDNIQPGYEWPSLYNAIGAMFSKPYNGDASKYLPTQYLAEEIKKMGFDGLRFNSSLHKGGVNVVLFDPELCKATSSDLVDVKEINITTDLPLIYKIGRKQETEKSE